MTGDTPAWLWSKVDDRHAYYWACRSCPMFGNLDGHDDDAAERHVTQTGHPVAITRSHTITLEGVSTSADQPHV